MPATEDEIQARYLERAIRELNDLYRELQSCRDCPRGGMMPVLPSGHPQADVMLVKYAATAAEVEEGVAFYGRAGNALLKSLRRLGIDPLTVYGTLCVKCPLADPPPTAICANRLAAEIAIVAPQIVVVMGELALAAVNRLELPARRKLEPATGKIQQLTPLIDALYVPDIDLCLDTKEDKQRFWTAFRALGGWYTAQPPY